MPRLTSLLLLALLPACLGSPGTETSAQTETSTQALISTSCGGGICVVDPIPAVDACPPGRQVGYLLPPDRALGCPAAPNPNWSGGPLFPPRFPPRNSLELANYCLYTWTGTGTPDLAGLPAMSGLAPADWLDPDCHVVAPLSPHPYEVRGAPLLEAAFRAQVEALQMFPGDVTGEPTKVVVVDSSPDTGFPNPAPGFVDHGFAMGQIIRQLGCASGLCLTQVASRLALNLRQSAVGPVEDPSGGTFGYQSQLAIAIVEGYEAAAAASANQNIIINLSVGWDAETGGGPFTGSTWSTTTDDVPARSVYSAINEVVCSGGLVIAAAGNDSGAGAGGPMYPGGWEEKDPPDSLRCSLEHGVSALRSTTSSYLPLLYAVGGVDGRDQPYALTRVGGVPPLVAPSDHAVVSYPSGSGTAYTHAYTGTSVSAAVASAIAGIVWAYRPTVAPADVMQALYDGGTGLGRGADFWLDDHHNMPLRRLSVCGSVTAACGPSPFCGGTPTCQALPGGRDARPVPIGTTGISATAVDASTVIHANPAPSPCEGTIYSVDPSGPDGGVFCPLRQYYANEIVPWVYPQPGEWVCPTCAISAKRLYLAISTDAPTTMSEPRLTVVNKLGFSKTFELKLGTALKRGATFEVTGLGFSSTDLKNMSKATFDVVVDSKEVNSSALLIEP